MYVYIYMYVDMYIYVIMKDLPGRVTGMIWEDTFFACGEMEVGCGGKNAKWGCENSLLGGSSQWMYVVKNHGDRKFPKSPKDRVVGPLFPVQIAELHGL